MLRRYADAKTVKLEEYIPAGCFRIVPVSYFNAPKGISETPVTIEVKPDFANSLSFKTPASGRICGFVRSFDGLVEKGWDYRSTATLQSMSLHDWDDVFLLAIEQLDDEQPELAYFVSQQEVRTLLEDCMRPA